MCGIYCSRDLSTFEILDQANKKRGNFATGVLILEDKTNNSKVIKRENGVDWNKVKYPGDNITYLGHNRAPTSSKRKFSKGTTHPFRNGNWVVAHNGIITNYRELIEDYTPDHTHPVDSSIIPAMLCELEYKKFGPCQNQEEEVLNLLFVLEKLQGPFAIWVYNTNSNNIYIARQGSTLFHKGTNISSIKGQRYREVSEGMLYKYTKTGLKPIDGFIAESPFLTL